MKHITIAVFLLFFGGCLPPKEPYEKTVNVVTANDSPPPQLVENVLIPQGFYLDTLTYLDSMHRICYSLEIPFNKSISFQKFLEAKLDALKMEIEKRAEARSVKLKQSLTDDPESLKNELARCSSFDLRPQSIYEDSSYISIRFYTNWMEGGPHGLPSYFVVNYDKDKDAEILFENYFQIISPQDSTHFISLVRTGLRHPELSVSKVYPFKFNLEGDSISFNFDAYELGAYAYGMPRSYVKKDQITSIIAAYDSPKYADTIKSYLASKVIEPTAVIKNSPLSKLYSLDTLNHQIQWQKLDKGIEIIVDGYTILTKDQISLNEVLDGRKDSLNFSNFLDEIKFYEKEYLIGFVLTFDICVGLGCSVCHHIIYDLKSHEISCFGRFKTGFELDLYHFNSDEKPDYLGKAFNGRDVTEIDKTEYVLFSQTENGNFSQFKNQKQKKYWFKHSYPASAESPTKEKFEEEWIEQILMK